MARIMMKKAHNESVSEAFEGFMLSAQSKGLTDKTFSVLLRLLREHHLRAQADISLSDKLSAFGSAFCQCWFVQGRNLFQAFVRPPKGDENSISQEKINLYVLNHFL